MMSHQDTLPAVVDQDPGATTPITSDTLTDHAKEIRRLSKQVYSDVVEIGDRLTRCKKIVGHGNWLSWLDREFQWTDRTARNFMRVFEESKSETFSDLNLPVSALYLLAAPSTPDAARAEIVKLAEAGAAVSVETVKDVIATKKGWSRARYKAFKAKKRNARLRARSRQNGSLSNMEIAADPVVAETATEETIDLEMAAMLAARAAHTVINGADPMADEGPDPVEAASRPRRLSRRQELEQDRKYAARQAAEIIATIGADNASIVYRALTARVDDDPAVYLVLKIMGVALKLYEDDGEGIPQLLDIKKNGTEGKRGFKAYNSNSAGGGASS
jgi:hypothetical protein